MATVVVVVVVVFFFYEETLQFLFRASCCFLVDLSQNTCCEYISQNIKRYFTVKKFKRLLRKKD